MMTAPTTALTILPYVRNISDLEVDDVADNVLADLSQISWETMMSDVGKREVEEQVEYIDEFRTNKIDGSNTTYWTKTSFVRWLGDYNLDKSLSIADVEVYAYLQSTRTAPTITAVTSSGSFTLQTAPAAGSKLYVSYLHLALPFYPLHPLLRKAWAELTCALAYGKLQARDYHSVGFRGLNLVKMTDGYSSYMNKYVHTLEQILNYDGFVRFDDKKRLRPFAEIRGANVWPNYGDRFQGPNGVWEGD